MFEKMATAWYEEMDNLYGKVDSFAGDLFHEGGKTHGIDVAAMAADVQKYMLKYNPEAVWCIQGWGGNPSRALLSSLKKRNTVVVELCNEYWKRWKPRHGFEGTPWIFSTVIMYGGNVALHGRLDSIANNLQEALSFDKKNAPVGLGATWESIDENPVVMDFIWDMLWRDKVPNINEWIKAYSVRRYGINSQYLKKAWVLLLNSAYKGHPGLRRPQETILCARPSLNVKKVSPFSATIKIQYEPKILKEAVGLLLKEANKCKNERTYQFDVVDMTRQFISNTAQLVYRDMIDAFQKRDKKRFNKDAEVFLEIFNDQNKLLGTEKLYLLGRWLNSARKLGPTLEQSNQNELNARLLITLWNNQKSSLHDYAWKEWNGMLKSFYKPRWEMFITKLRNELDGKKSSNLDTYPFEIAWAEKKWEDDSYITEPKGEPVATSIVMYKKYCKVFNDYNKQ
jgi:alpha-N-acetylglucosaminidase